MKEVSDRAPKRKVSCDEEESTLKAKRRKVDKEEKKAKKMAEIASVDEMAKKIYQHQSDIACTSISKSDVRFCIVNLCTVKKYMPTTSAIKVHIK